MRIDLVGKGPIVFEGRELPDVAKGFDLVPFWDQLPDATCDWLMNLHYCWGRTRQLSSRRILRHVKLIKNGLEAHQSNAAEGLRRRFPDATEEQLQELVAGWHEALAIIKDCAAETRTCRWTITADDESLEANLKLAIKLLQNNVASTGIEFRIRNMPKEKQLEWLVSFTDSFSKKRPWWQQFRDGWRNTWRNNHESTH